MLMLISVLIIVLHEFHLLNYLASILILLSANCSKLILVFVVTANQRPVYPSSKSKRTDWDKLEAQVKKEVL